MHTTCSAKSVSGMQNLPIGRNNATYVPCECTPATDSYHMQHRQYLSMQGQSVWLAMLAEVTQGNPAISTLTYLRTTCHQQSTCPAQSISSPQQILPIYMPATCLSKCLRASQTVLTFCKKWLASSPSTSASQFQLPRRGQSLSCCANAW